MNEIKEIMPLVIIGFLAVYIWWINKDRQRVNTYLGEAEEAKKYREESYKHMKRSMEHMDKIEKSLDRIASALEEKK